MLVLGLVALGACSDDGAVTGDLGLDGLADLPSWDGLAPDGALPDGGDTACLPGPALLARVDPARMLKDLQFLVGLGERRSYTGQTKAAAYLRAELQQLPGVQLREQSYTYAGQTYVNLEATIAGAELPGEYIMAGGHYDSNSPHPTLAPGADDNASGTAAVVELARVLAGCTPRRSVRLLLFSNEEKGLIGSYQYVASIKGVLPPDKLTGFIAMDMIAYGPDGEDLDLATRPAYETFVDDTAAAVQQHTTLKIKKIVSDHCG